MTPAAELHKVVAETGGFSFPCSMDLPDGGTATFCGLTIRDWFAAHALPALITEMTRGNVGDHPVAGGGPKGFAASAYEIADAMLVAREGGA